MDLHFNCPQCRQKLVAETSGIGESISCPVCGKLVVIPTVTHFTWLTGWLKRFLSNRHNQIVGVFVFAGCAFCIWLTGHVLYGHVSPQTLYYCEQFHKARATRKPVKELRKQIDQTCLSIITNKSSYPAAVARAMRTMSQNMDESSAESKADSEWLDKAATVNELQRHAQSKFNLASCIFLGCSASLGFFVFLASPLRSKL